MRQVLVLVIFASILAAGPAMGQPARSQAQAPAGEDPMSSIWNPQLMIDRSVKAATKRYNLTPDQEKLARQMTTERVGIFLDRHERDLRDLVREAIQARFASQPPSPEKVQAWARRVGPLFEEARKEILQGNQEFRNALTDEQKKAFDTDQQVLQRQFGQTEQMLTRWKDGGFDASRDWTHSRQRPEPRPIRPELDRFQRYARRFIEDYKLDAGQTTQVMAIVTESRKRAEEYWYSRKADIEVTRQRVQELSRDPNARQQYQAASKQLSELNRPVDDLYEEMKARLDQIPGEAQRQARDQEMQTRRQRWRDQMRDSGRGPVAVSSQTSATQAVASGPASRPVAQGPGSRPASTRPADAAASRSRRGAAAARSSQPATQPAARAPQRSDGIR